MTHDQILRESSPNTLRGSFTPDLSLSKLWLASKLRSLNLNEFDTIYILGSWFGNMTVFLNSMNINANTIINVDVNRVWLKTSEILHQKLQLPYEIQYMHKDANNLDYRQLTKNSAVINTSCNDMQNDGWFNLIPSRTLVALQARNQIDKHATNNYTDLKEFTEAYPMSKILFDGVMSLQDPQIKYQRYMVIGIK